MAATCTLGLDLVACIGSSGAGPFRSHFIHGSRAKGLLRNADSELGAQKLLHCRQGVGWYPVRQWIKNPNALRDGVGDEPLQAKDRTKKLIRSFSRLDIFQLVADDLLTLDENLRLIVDAENPILMSALEQIFGASGKRMRPALVFLASRATGEITGLRELSREHRRLAEIIELLHTASLIHDDVLDESGLRRGKKTINELYGRRVAVLVGDFMFAQSSLEMASLGNLDIVKLISKVIKDFAIGEIKQASSLFNCNIRLDDYLFKSYCKTASLIAACTKGAAIFSSVNDQVIDQMHWYGKNLGISFQLVDDILDFTQSTEQLGKPAGSDLARGNLTAPVIFAMEKEPTLRDMIESEFCEEGSLEKAIEIVKTCGGIEEAWELAREKADEAIENLGCLPKSCSRLALEQIVEYNLHRIV